MTPVTWLLRLARWVRHPPSPRFVRFMGALALLLGALYAIEAIWGWPDWLTVDPPRRRPF